jgi:parallel beta-helix repeat protein
MVRLPTPGSDTNQWGDILNEFLRVEHNSDGSLKANGTIASKGTIRGDWATVTSYSANDIVQMQGGSFVCTASHTSSANTGGFLAAFQTDKAAGRWRAMSPWRQWYDIRDYGARMDNGNDTVAIQAAIDACAAAGGGSVYIPAGTVGVTTLVIKNHVWLRGAGKWATTIRCLSNTNAPVIKNFVSPDGVQANAEFFAVMDLRINGNRAANTNPGSHGISITSYPLYSKATNDDWHDMHYLIQNIMILDCGGIGITATGRSEGRYKNIYVERCNQGGISPSFDSYLEGCSAGNNDQFGFSFTHGNIMAVECKAFISGRSYGTNSPGFYISQATKGCTLTACIAQNNNGQGFRLHDTSGIILSGCVADSNNYGDGNAASAYAGVELDNASNCIIDFVSQQTEQDGVQIGNQSSALRLVNGSDNNDIRTVTISSGSYVLGSTVTADSTLANNRIVANGIILNPPTSSSSSGILGDGSDGAAVLDGTNTVSWATLAGSTYSMIRDANTTSLTINSGITLVSTGFRIFSSGAVTNNGTISADGVNATSATGPSGGTTRTLGVGAKGGNGATGAGIAGVAGGFGVGNGGAGGNGSSGVGGTATNAITGQNWMLRNGHGLAVNAIGYANAVSPISGGSGGSGGAGDGTNSGGGGGSGGGVIGILARSFTNAGTMTAKGGNGFAPTTGNCGGGGGGGGGGIFVLSVVMPTNTGSRIVTGGTGAAGSGSGTAGGNGLAGTILFTQLL